MKKIILFILFSFVFCVICFCQQRPLTASESRLLATHRKKVDSMERLFIAAKLKLEKARKANPELIDQKIGMEYTWRQQWNDSVNARMKKATDSINRKRLIRRTI